MDIALYHPWLKEKGGAEKVVLEIAERSKHDITIYTLFYDKEKCFKQFQNLEVVELRGREPEGYVRKGLEFALGSVLAEIPSDHDKLLVSEAGMGSLVTLRNDIEAYCYCHTPFRVFLPEFSETYKKEITPVLRPFFGIMKKTYDFFEKKAWNSFEKVIANSKTTKKRIIEKGLASEVEVVHPGADIDNNGESYEKYFLYPSRFRRYKRQDLAVEAFKQADLEDFKLVLAGSAQEEDYVEELRDKATENIEIKTDVPGDEWEALYANCYSVLFLAENEDWGIIPVEAGSYSKPVIAVDEGGPSESVIDGETGYLVEASPEKIAEKMEELASDSGKVEEMGKKGREQSKKYSWANFAEKIDEVVK